MSVDPLAGASVVTHGFKELERRIDAAVAEDHRQQARSARAAANVLKVVMRRMAPYKRDAARKRAHVKHLRATITVRDERMAGVPAFSVGPRSRVAHLVVRGTQQRHEVVGGLQGENHAKHRASLAEARQLRFNARGYQGPRFGEARALAWSDGGEMRFAHSSNPGPMPRNDFIQRTRAIASGEARAMAAAVLFHGAPDPNEGA